MLALIVFAMQCVGIAGSDALSVHEMTGTLNVEGRPTLYVKPADQPNGTLLRLVFPSQHIERAARTMHLKTVRVEGVRCEAGTVPYVMVTGIGPTPKK